MIAVSHPTMTRQDPMFAALRQVREEAAKAQDPEKLHRLILEINSLLNVIEKRLAQLEEENGNQQSN